MDNLEKVQEFVSQLRAIASWVEEHPELGAPHFDRVDYWPSSQQVGQFARAFGSCEKDDLGGNYFILRKMFGAIRLEATWTRTNVCQRLVTGQEEVEEEVTITPAVTEKRKVLKDKVEWQCPQVLR